MAAELIGTRQFVVTCVGDTYCGVPIAAVVEIMPFSTVTPVPQSPPAVLGMFNFRGRVVLVADFRACLGFETKPITEETRIVLVSHREETVGLVVDAVTEVITVETDSLHSVSGMPLGSGCVLNTTQLGDRLMLEVDYERALDEGMSGVTGHHALPLSELLRAAAPTVAVTEDVDPDEEALESPVSLVAPRGGEVTTAVA